MAHSQIKDDMQQVTKNLRVAMLTVASAVAVCLLIVRFGGPDLPERTKVHLSPGVKLSPPKGFKWRRDKPTLVFVLHVGCPHCENEMPFYEDILSLAREKKTKAELVAFFPDSELQVNTAFYGRLVGLTRLTDVNMDRLMVRGTPTLFVVDSGGVVRSVWVGELTPAQERSVMNAVRVGG